MRIVSKKFFNQRAEELAPQLLGKVLCIRKQDGEILKSNIVEVEAYTGLKDTASHSSKGKTARNAVMWESGGKAYIYICYGIHFILNIVCGGLEPEGVLIRGVEKAVGPGRLTKFFGIDKSLYGEDLMTSEKIWLEKGNEIKEYKRSKRIGIDYAEPKDRDALLRFYL